MIVPAFDNESISTIKRRARAQAMARPGAGSTLQLLLNSGQAREFQAPPTWMGQSSPSLHAIPPTLLDSGTVLEPSVRAEDLAAWNKEVEKAYIKKVNSDPLLSFAEGAGSVWPTWQRVDTRKLNEGSKVAYYAGNIAGKAAVGFLGGAVLGRILGGFGATAKAIEKIATAAERHPLAAKAISGTMKGLLVGGEAAKGVKMKEEGYGWTDVVGSVAGDFTGLYGFEKGLTKTLVPRVSKELAIQKAHENSRHRIYLGKTNNFLIGKDISPAGEKPLIIDKGPRAKLLPDRTRATVGAVEMTYKGRPLGERPVIVKRFMTAGERTAMRGKFPLVGIKQEEIFSGGLPAQIQVTKVIPKMKYDSMFGTFRSALKEASKASTLVAEVGAEVLRNVGTAGYGIYQILKKKQKPGITSAVATKTKFRFITMEKPAIRSDSSFDSFQIVVPREVIKMKQEFWPREGTRPKPTPSPGIIPPKTKGIQIPAPPLLFPGIPRQKPKTRQRQKTRSATTPPLGKIGRNRGKNRFAPPTPFGFPFGGAGSSSGGEKGIDEWSKKNNWGDLKLSLASLKAQFQEIKRQFSGRGW